MAVKKTIALMQMYEQQRRSGGHDDELAQEIRRAAEEEIRREDNRLFRGGDPIGHQLGPQLSRMLRDKPVDYETKVREGSKGTRG